MKKLICFLIGHEIETPEHENWRAFKTRFRIAGKCERCRANLLLQAEKLIENEDVIKISFEIIEVREPS